MAIIGIMDSGVGGLSVFREIKKLLPDERYIYYADSAFCPYGEKSPEVIRQRCVEITDMMISKGTHVVVLACNTATAAAISYLRAHYDIPFVGMEPAVKPAVGLTKSGVVGVLATEGTLKGLKYRTNKAQYEGKVRIIERPGKGFVELVEKGNLTGGYAEKVVAESLEPLLEAGADTIVLGCTHYPFLAETMKKVAGDGITFVNPAPAIASHLVAVLRENGISVGDGTPAVELLSSGDDAVLQSFFKLI